MDPIKEICDKRNRAHQKLVSLDSKVYKAFLEMEKATYSAGALPKKTKELIAIGISVVMDCQSCMQWHIEQASKAGASQQEILEAVEVGIEMGAGRATVSARFALDVMEAVYNNSEFRRQKTEARMRKIKK
jgi:AhpD family alkylhydroperoxidase